MATVPAEPVPCGAGFLGTLLRAVSVARSPHRPLPALHMAFPV